MKKLFTFLNLIILSLTILAQEFVPLLVDEDTINVQHAATEVVDINNDGILDILISGEADGDNPANGIFISGGDKTFTLSEETNVVTPGFIACIDHGDIDADGDLDFIFNGWGADGAVTNGIAMNDGNGVLSLNTSLEIGTSAPSSGFADLNNDALLDYYFFGNGAATCAIWFQNQDGTFTKDGTSFASFDFTDPQPSVIDFNNDGYPDIFINGWENNQGGRFTKLFINDFFGGFTVSDQPNIIQKGYGSATWFDIDADGNLDLLLNGDGGADGEGSSDIYRIYKNNNGTLVEAATFNDYRQISVEGGARFADLDNDGDADIVLTGWSVTEDRQVTMVFECTDATNFVYTRHAWSDVIPGVSESDVEVGDFNNDNKIDFVISGFSGDFGRRLAGVVFNDMETANTRPGAPSNLVNDDIEGGGVMFSWDAGTDNETPAAALTYSLYLKDTGNDKWLINPGADVTGDDNGIRKITGMGNVDNSLEWPIYELPNGDYEWSVQSIDGIYVGSVFPEPIAFTVDEGGTSISQNSVDLIAKVFVNQNELNVLFDAYTVSAKINIYTIEGRLISSDTVNSPSYLKQLETGFYFVQVTNEGNLQTTKIVVY